MSNPIGDPNPHNLTFPYPQQGTVMRPPGEGCTSCVHARQCPAVYWLKRYSFYELHPSNGIQCASWDDDPAHKTLPVAQSDLDENTYMYNQQIQSEPNRNGIVSPVTASMFDRG